MRTVRRHISIFLTTVMIFTFMPFSNLFKVESFAVQDGKCGVNAYWSISGSTLTISGTGAIYDYEPGTHGPWDDSGDTYTSIVIGSGITRIGEFAFHESPAESVSIPDTVTSIGTGAFASSALTSVTIPGSVESWQEAFVMCESLQTAEIMPGVTKIDVMSFGGCSNLESVNSLPNSVTEICNCAFQYCESLDNIHLSETVTKIGNNAFEGCSNMDSIEFSNTLTEIGENAFDDCYSLSDIYYCGSEADWSSITIGTGNECLRNATINYNYNPHALDEAMAKIPEIKTYYSDESVEALNAVLEEIYEGTENISEQELAELVERLNEALANLELKSYQITVPDGCTATQTEVDGVNYKLATITAPQQNANGEYFVYWTDDSGNIVSTYRTYSFYVGSSTSYTPVYASAQNYDSAKAAALITSRVIDVKNNGDGNLVFLAEHSVSSTKELNGHGMIITSNESFADEELLVRGSENEDIKDFMAQKTKNSKTGMLQVSANVSGNTIWARTYVIDKETGDTLYGRIQSYNVNSGTLSSDNEVIVLDSYDIDSTEYNTQSEEAPVQDIPAEESGSILSVIINIIMTIIRNIDVIIKSMLSIIK